LTGRIKLLVNFYFSSFAFKNFPRGAFPVLYLLIKINNETSDFLLGNLKEKHSLEKNSGVDLFRFQSFNWRFILISA